MIQIRSATGHYRNVRWIAVLLFLAVAGNSVVKGDSPSAMDDWPWWRGPQHNGVAPPGPVPPLKWTASSNVIWKTPIPGKGHGSPIIVGNQVILAIADLERNVQALVCYHRETGKQVWESIIHRGGLQVKNEKSSAASSTPACDGDRIFINFLNSGAVYTTAVNRNGKQIWQAKISDYVIHQGYGASPTLYQSLVLVSADNKGGGALAALDRQTGETIWKRERPATANYASPIVLNVAGKDQLIMTGCEHVTSYDPLTGKTNWDIEGATTECVTSTVTDGTHVYSSGGYPRNHVAAIRADGSGKVAWENGARVYVPSMLLVDGYLYATLDAGMAACWNAATGEEQWKSRLGGTFTSSPVLAGDRIYAMNEAGETFILRATAAKFELLAQNDLAAEVYSTPSICGGRIYVRAAERVDDRRQEFLICLGEESDQ